MSHTGKPRPRLQQYYRDTVVSDLQSRFQYDNVMRVPRLVKVVLNMGLGRDAGEKGVMERVVDDMTRIAGQKAVVTKARESVANFKLREGWPIGCMVTLRRRAMYYFMDRLISIAIPRVRDFRGLNKNGFDGRGNYNMGLREQIVFPEVDHERIEDIRGMDVAIVTSAVNDEEGRALLRALKLPLRE